jgi:hypothetical protein
MCAAVGSYVVTNPYYKSLTEIWNGTGWTIEPVASPGSRATEISLASVSCASATSCVAVGSYQNSAGIEKSLTEVWDGSDWALVRSPNPSGEEVSSLEGVSCRSANSCVAVGYWSSVSQVLHTLAERWNGTTWEIEATPTSGGETNDTLNAVSCATTSECIAVGTSAGTPVAEGWNGSSWTTEPTPKLTGYSSFAGVSCPTASSCIAVGSGAGTPLAENWDGSSWTLQSTPSLAAGGSLAAVSCAAQARCTAAGQTSNTAGTPVPLAERYA